MRGFQALALLGFSVGWLAAAAGCGTKQGACVFDDICSQGSSYEGKGGQSLCRGNGGTWDDNGCPMTDKCLGKCNHPNDDY
jgi:hypothetical protein